MRKKIFLHRRVDGIDLDPRTHMIGSLDRTMDKTEFSSDDDATRRLEMVHGHLPKNWSNNSESNSLLS